MTGSINWVGSSYIKSLDAGLANHKNEPRRQESHVGEIRAFDVPNLTMLMVDLTEREWVQEAECASES